MEIDYSDITTRAGEPKWWDSKGAPRYCEFSPDEDDVYAEMVVLINSRCQDHVCDAEFLVARSLGLEGRINGVTMSSWLDMLKNADEFGLPLGDPPRHGGCIGETMNSVALEIKEVWTREQFREWTRRHEHERLVEDSDE